MKFRPYYDTWEDANVVVDASPRHGTILTLSHWPSVNCGTRYRADTSTEMVIRYLKQHKRRPEVGYITASHFDVDALLAVYSFLCPDIVLPNADLWIEVANAGDFDRSQSSHARKIARALEYWADEYLSPMASSMNGKSKIDRHLIAFADLLPNLAQVIDNPDRLKNRWAEGEELYERSLHFLTSIDVSVENRPELDLTVVRSKVEPKLVADTSYLGFDPFAVHQIAKGSTVALVFGRHYRVVQRYESWVQFCSRPIRQRRDFSPLCEWLSEIDHVEWQYQGVHLAAPTMRPIGMVNSNVDPIHFENAILEYLAKAPGAWNPFSFA